ncbi:MAG TPA: ABC transporter substrate-binding protein [candidate division Zixibacteria bacterium]|nr:ABC transporter substrate-binding protein [candidate division Zixibacteria bacterium]
MGFSMLTIASLLFLALRSGAASAEPVRAGYPSPNVQFLPAFVALEKGFYRSEGLEVELVSVRSAITAVQALIGNQMQFVLTIGPQMPAIWEGTDIVLLAQQVGRPTFSMITTTDIQKVGDLKGKKIGVSFGGSTFAGTKALLELHRLTDKDVQYVNIPGSGPKVAALKQGIIAAALLAPPSDYVAVKAGFKRLVNLADVFRDTAFTGLAATGRTVKENPRLARGMVRAIVRGVYHTRDNPEDAIQVMMKHLRMERDAAADAYELIRESLNPIPTEKGVELMAQWQAVALNTRPKRRPAEYMNLTFVNDAVRELGRK